MLSSYEPSSATSYLAHVSPDQTHPMKSTSVYPELLSTLTPLSTPSSASTDADCTFSRNNSSAAESQPCWARQPHTDLLTMQGCSSNMLTTPPTALQFPSCPPAPKCRPGHRLHTGLHAAPAQLQVRDKLRVNAEFQIGVDESQQAPAAIGIERLLRHAAPICSPQDMLTRVKQHARTGLLSTTAHVKVPATGHSVQAGAGHQIPQGTGQGTGQGSGLLPFQSTYSCLNASRLEAKRMKLFGPSVSRPLTDSTYRPFTDTEEFPNKQQQTCTDCNYSQPGSTEASAPKLFQHCFPLDSVYRPSDCTSDRTYRRSELTEPLIPTLAQQKLPTDSMYRHCGLAEALRSSSQQQKHVTDICYRQAWGSEMSGFETAQQELLTGSTYRQAQISEVIELKLAQQGLLTDSTYRQAQVTDVLVQNFLQHQSPTHGTPFSPAAYSQSSLASGFTDVLPSNTAGELLTSC